MANPVLTEQRFQIGTSTNVVDVGSTTNRMTKAGVLSATGVLLVLLLAGATAGWWKFSGLVSGNSGLSHTATVDLVIEVILALVAGIAAALLPKLAKILGPIYALTEGFVVGAISSAYNNQYHGIVVMAVGATLGVALAVYVLYATGTIKVTARLRATIMAATIGVLGFYLVAWLISLIGGTNILSTGGPLGIGISLITAGVAASNLLLDFDFIDRAIAAGAEKNYEWYSAFGVLVTLVWLYLEILRLLSYFRR